MRIFRGVSRVVESWDAFFHARCPLHVSALFRIGYAILLLINVACWLPDLHAWFGVDGLFPEGTTQQYWGFPLFSVLDWLPKRNSVAYLCYGVFVFQIMLLLAGGWTRFQAVCVFLWLLSFQNHSPLLWAGEDAVFSLFGLLLVFLPAGEVCSLDARRRNRQRAAQSKPFEETQFSIWPLRMIQIQTCLIVFASGLQKASGEAWQSGTALYYVARLDDSFGRFPMPLFLTHWMPAVRLTTWLVIVLELLVPLCVWHPRLRRPALTIAILLHLGIEYSMDLFLFEWIMILGWCSFFSDDLARRVLRMPPLREPAATATAASGS